MGGFFLVSFLDGRKFITLDSVSLWDRQTRKLCVLCSRFVFMVGLWKQQEGALGPTFSRGLPHLNQLNCSSTVLPLFPAAWRQLGLCKGMVAVLVLGIHRANFLGDALLTSVFCYSHQGSILQCWKQKQILLSLSSGSQWHCAQQFLLTWKPTERHCLTFLVSKDSNNLIFGRCK